MNHNGKLNAARLSSETGGGSAPMGNSAKPMPPRTVTPASPSTVNKVVSAAGGAAVGLAGSVGGLLGADPRRSTVPANNYGKENKAFGKAYNIASAPGSLAAKTYQKIGKAL